MGSIKPKISNLHETLTIDLTYDHEQDLHILETDIRNRGTLSLGAICCSGEHLHHCDGYSAISVGKGDKNHRRPIHPNNMAAVQRVPNMTQRVAQS
jgi:hypothetical protein